MKPAPFEYVKAVSVADAVALLTEHRGDARLLAGGQSLVPMLNMRLLRPSVVIDVNGLADALGEIALQGDAVAVGALVRYAEIERSALVAERVPLLRHVVAYIGDRQVRNRGTVGGAVAHADPTGEIALVTLALGAIMRAEGPDGVRDIPAEAFFLGPYTTALAPDEMLTHIIFPPAAPAFRFFERGRKHNDFAVLSLAVVGRPEPDGTWRDIRIALGGVHDRPVLAAAAARALEGRRWDDALVRDAALLALEDCDPPDDFRASAEYRRHLVPVHVRRMLSALAGGHE